MVLEHGLIVVKVGDYVPRFHYEDVVEAGVLHVVASGGEYVRHQFEFVHFCLFAHASVRCHVVEGLGQVGCVCPVVVRYVLVQRRNPAHESEKLKFVQVYFFEDAFFRQDVADGCAELLAVHQLLNVKNVEIVLLDFFKFEGDGRRAFHLLLDYLCGDYSQVHQFEARCQRREVFD